MKNLKKCLLGILLLAGGILTTNFITETSLANEPITATVAYKGSSQKFAVMVSDVLHLKVAIATAEQLKVKEKKLQFEIVAVGELAKALVEDASLVEEFDKAEKMGVKIVVCEIALNFFKVPKEKLDKRLHTTPNALIYMFELKDKKFNTMVI